MHSDRLTTSCAMAGRLRVFALSIGIVATLPSVSIAGDDPPSNTQGIVFSNDDYPAFVFQEDDYVLFPDGDRLFVGDKDLVLEAQVAPDLRFFSNMDAATERVFGVHEKSDCPKDNKPLDQRKCFRRHWGRSVFGTIMVRMRMYRGDSNPVRTPSFMPKVTTQWVGFKSLSNPYNKIEPVGSTVSVSAVNLVVGHYSNGQEECLFKLLEPNEDCESITAWTEREINTQDGSFSTNYIRLGKYWGLMTIGDDNDVVTEQKGFRVELEYHPCRGCDGGGWLQEPLRSLYGDTQVKLTFDYAKAQVWKFHRLESRIGINLIVGCPHCKHSYGLTAEVFAQKRSWNGVGYYLRFDNGRDYYNTAFEKGYRKRFVFGLAFNLGKFFSFPF